MSVTLDVNVLLYASDETSDMHEPATRLVAEIAAGPDIAYVFWPVVVSYLRIATHPRIFKAPLERAAAMRNVESLVNRPHIRTPGEGPGFWKTFSSQLDHVRARGNLVSDAHLVALMREHGVRRIWTRDRDFRKFDGIEAIDPFA